MQTSKNQRQQVPDSKLESQTGCARSATQTRTASAKGPLAGIASSVQKKDVNAIELEPDSAAESPSQTPSTPAGGREWLQATKHLSRQRRWQIKKANSGCCIQCGETINNVILLGVAGPCCEECFVKRRERAKLHARKKRGHPLEGDLKTKKGTPDRRGRPRKYNI